MGGIDLARPIEHGTDSVQLAAKILDVLRNKNIGMFFLLNGVVFAVNAKLQKSGKAIYYLLGGVVAAGVTYFLLSKPQKGSVSITIPGEI